MIALPIFLQMVLEYSARGAGLSIVPLSLSMFAVASLGGSVPGVADRPRSSEQGSRGARRDCRADPHRPACRVRMALVVPLVIAGCGLGLLVSQLNN